MRLLLPAQSASFDPGEQQHRQAESSAQLCDRVSYPAPDTPHPFRLRQSSSGLRSDRALFLLPDSSLVIEAMRQPDTPQQILKARVGAQRIEFRVHSQPDQPDGSLVASLFKPRQSLLVVTQSQKNLREVKGRLKLLTRLLPL